MVHVGWVGGQKSCLRPLPCCAPHALACPRPSPASSAPRPSPHSEETPPLGTIIPAPRALLRRSHGPPLLNWLRGRSANYVPTKILGPVFFSARWRVQQKPAFPGSRQPQGSWSCNLGAGRVHWQHASIHARCSRNNLVGRMLIKCFRALPVGVSWVALGTNVIGCPQPASDELDFILGHLLPYLAQWWRSKLAAGARVRLNLTFCARFCGCTKPK